MSNLKDAKSKAVKITLNDGVERELKFTLNAMAELEDMYGSVDAAFKALNGNSFKAVRAVLWAGLLHENPDITVQQVGNLIDIKDLEAITANMELAMSNDMPEDKADEAALPNE